MTPMVQHQYLKYTTMLIRHDISDCFRLRRLRCMVSHAVFTKHPSWRAKGVLLAMARCVACCVEWWGHKLMWQNKELGRREGVADSPEVALQTKQSSQRHMQHPVSLFIARFNFSVRPQQPPSSPDLFISFGGGEEGGGEEGGGASVGGFSSAQS